jgi:peptidoglycan/LPS O-acetylase OafA/YrhL
VFTGLGWSASDVSTAVYQLTFNHLDAFALGSLIAFHEDQLRALTGSALARRLNWLVPVALGGLAVVCIVLQNLQAPATGKDILTDAFAVKPELLSGQLLVYALGAFGAGGLLVLILTGSRLVSVLASDSLVRLGTISFGLYVWHFPLLWIFADAGHRSLVAAGLYLWATLGAALLSYRYLEQPARRWLEARWNGRSISPEQSPTSAGQNPVLP